MQCFDFHQEKYFGFSSLLHLYYTFVMQGKKKSEKQYPLLFSSLHFIPSTFSSFWVCLYEWAQKDLGNHGAGEKPQASTFFLLLLLSRQSWFSYIGGRKGQEKVTVGWLGHSQLSPTRQAFAQSRYPLGRRRNLGAREKNRWLGLFRSDHSLNVRGISLFSLYLYTDTLSDWWGMDTFM